MSHISHLREKLQATAPLGGREPLVGKSVRFFSIFFTALFIRTKITPNKITLISVFFFILGMSLFVLHSYWWTLLGVVTVYFSIVLDACDGEVARFRAYKSNSGALYVEPVSHDFQYSLMFIPVSLGVYYATGSILFIYLGFIATISKLFFRLLRIRFEDMLREDGKSGGKVDGEGEIKYESPKNPGLIHRVYRFFNTNVFRSSTMVLPMFLFALADKIDWFLWFYAAGFTAIALAHLARQMMYISRINRLRNVPVEKFDNQT